MAKKSTPRNSGDPPPQNVLYVVLHGLICLVDKGTAGFTGHLLDRSNDPFIQHVYKAGDFGKEKDLDRFEALTLNGVDTGSAKLSPTMNPILKNPNPQDQTFFARNTISLVRPNSILHFVCGDPEANLKDNDELIKKQPLISGIRVFQYSFKNYNDVNVSGDKSFSWKCPNAATAVFHLYNEPEVDPGGVRSLRHSLSEFNDSVGFMQETSKVELKNAIVKAVPGDQRPPGLPPEQVSALSVRDRVAAIVKKQQRRTPLKKEEEFLLIHGKDDRGGAGGTQVCGGING
ncbi:MAG TPA: hypothetical protein VGK36_15855 [Candidatus Angelobacter sp.]